MANALTTYGPLALRGLLTLTFGAAGAAKLVGAAPMVEVFDTIGWGQWFRYVTGIIEVGSAALLWVPAYRLIGTLLLIATMICAIGFHVLVLGPSFVPAAVLLVLLVGLAAIDRASKR